ncbi:MAG: efflux RND transporter periplasmic adaptor subunit [bacterium]
MKRSALLITLISLLALSCGKNDNQLGGSGLIEATQTLVSAEVAGQIEQVLCDEGDHLEIGDTLARIDTTTVALQLKQAEAGLSAAQAQIEVTRIDIQRAAEQRDLAQKEFDRAAKLIVSGSVNQQQYDQAENALAQAKLSYRKANAALAAAEADIARLEAQVALLQQQLAYCTPLSPVSGVVTEKYIEVGELVAPGRPLVEIARLDTVWVKIYLPPQHLTAIALGATAEVDPEDGRTEPLVGRVSWIASEAEFTPKNVQTKEARADLVYAVKIEIANPEQALKIGMPVAVRIP